jgi:hypothetical protein
MYADRQLKGLQNAPNYAKQEFITQPQNNKNLDTIDHAFGTCICGWCEVQ